MTLYDISGRQKTEVFSSNLRVGTHTITIATSDLPAGVYFLSLRTPRGGEKAKFIVTR